jgi:hypothetical protein
MKQIFKKASILALTLSISFVSCEGLDIENTNQPDKEQALSNPSDVESLINGASNSMLLHLVGFSGIFPNLMADQTTTTNAYQGFWSFADQPRLQINNSPTNGNLGASVGNNWPALNNYIFSANTIIDLVEFKGNSQVVDGVDKAPEMLATAYFVKGVSQGHLALMYNQAYIVNPDTDFTSLAFSDYNAMSAEAVKNIEKSISLATNLSSYEYFVYAGYTLNKSSFLKLANSFAAKIMINTPRTKAEASTVDYAKVLTFANAGLTESFNPPTNGGYEFYNNMQDWSTYTLSDGAGYLPTDQKVLNYLDSSYPKDYPTDNTIVLGQINSTDNRAATYFQYSSAFGFLRESRGRELFSNYRNLRFFTGNDRGTLAGLSTDIFHVAELDYIKAEATYKTAGASAAAAILNSSARFTKGGITTAATDIAVEEALAYEYAVELDLATTIGTQWFFMRRYDQLQKGTPLNYPVPGNELEITGTSLYTFGGASNTDAGTATGSNSWLNN